MIASLKMKDGTGKIKASELINIGIHFCKIIASECREKKKKTTILSLNCEIGFSQLRDTDPFSRDYW